MSLCSVTKAYPKNRGTHHGISCEKMTVISAMVCKDGVVLGADTQGGITSKGGSIRHFIRKIYPIGKRTLFMATGTIGLMQKYTEVLAKHSDDLDKGLTFEAMDPIRKELFAIAKQAKDYFVEYNKSSEGVPVIDLVLGGYDAKGKPTVYHLSGDLHDEFVDTVGSYASGCADTFAFTLIKSFEIQDMDVLTAEMVLYRALKDTIKVCAKGVGEPIDMWEINKTDGIKQLDKNNIKHLEKTYASWKRTEHDFLLKIR